MILQLAPALPLWSVKHGEECYALILFEYGLEDYVYFLVAMEKTGELWVLPSSEVRASKSFTAGRPSINKDAYSAYLKRGDHNIYPIGTDTNTKDDI